jgi:two-component system, NtrC family, response regulator AtoC
VQVKLLRFLGERTFERVGSSKTLMSDVRLIAATNKNLVTLVQSGAFREDLFFRLKVVEIHLPPLRERTQDIPLLAQHFLRDSAAENGKDVNAIAPDALELLMAYKWPGNVRELRTAIEHAVVFARGKAVGARDLPQNIRLGQSSLPTPVSKMPTSDLNVHEVEKELVVRALKECDGNRSAAARKLGVSRRTLHRKLHEFHLEGF